MTDLDKAPLVVQAQNVTPVEGGTVEVTAPADLQAGYVLSVNVGGSVRSVTVPEGGVKEGQVFQAEPAEGGGHFVPTGNWRDGLCDCCKFGCCHPLLCMGWCFEPILAGQVMTRMSRSWTGGPGARPSVSNTCGVVTGIFVVVSLAQSILQVVMDNGHCLGGHVEYDFAANPPTEYIACPDGTTEPMTAQDSAMNTAIGIVAGLFGLYMLIAICRTRAAMRAKYNIAPGGCGGCEDCCCAAFCSCCTLQQMARHTHDYATHEVACCGSDCFNKRGQPEHIPEIDV